MEDLSIIYTNNLLTSIYNLMSLPSKEDSCPVSESTM